MNILGAEISFPPIESADEDGLLAIGGDLSAERLLLAYKSGIFPWYNEYDPVCWWSPDPRCVLFPEKLVVSKSMQQLIRKGVFEFRFNTQFETVIRNCSTIPRQGQPGTWIHEEMIEAYINLHWLGYAISAEAWKDGQLAGGLYGVKIGKVFYGESMFSKESNASKFAFIQLVHQLQDEGVKLIDCQMKTDHLLSLGAEMISRMEFKGFLERSL